MPLPAAPALLDAVADLVRKHDALLGLERRHEVARHPRAAVDHAARDVVIARERRLGLGGVKGLGLERVGNLERRLAHVATALPERLAVVGKAIGQGPAALRIERKEEAARQDVGKGRAGIALAPRLLEKEVRPDRAENKQVERQGRQKHDAAWIEAPGLHHVPPPESKSRLSGGSSATVSASTGPASSEGRRSSAIPAAPIHTPIASEAASARAAGHSRISVGT